jgi:hypothetical protein
MLFQERDINWNDYPTHLKRGSCCIKIEDGRSFWFIDKNIPIFKGENREYIEKHILYGVEGEPFDEGRAYSILYE